MTDAHAQHGHALLGQREAVGWQVDGIQGQMRVRQLGCRNRSMPQGRDALGGCGQAGIVSRQPGLGFTQGQGRSVRRNCEAGKPETKQTDQGTGGRLADMPARTRPPALRAAERHCEGHLFPLRQTERCRTAALIAGQTLTSPGERSPGLVLPKGSNQETGCEERRLGRRRRIDAPDGQGSLLRLSLEDEHQALDQCRVRK
ncbi:hypothetical protein GALL_508650 [mine drainage metagenome]|uniref:Uncharacterized protein n=1 Tax=mine drainage metagenome TaxID=410659 RepID=A0A1J5P8M0_9ZZZZ